MKTSTQIVKKEHHLPFVAALWIAATIMLLAVMIIWRTRSPIQQTSSPTSILYTTHHSADIYKDEVLRFAVIADPHIGQNWHGREGGNSARLRQALVTAREHNAEFFVALGDITQSGSKEELEEAKRILEEGKLRYFTIPGNHDVFQDASYYELFFGPKHTVQSYTLRTQAPLGYAPLAREAKLYFFDMTNINSEYGDTLGHNQQAWLREEMAKNINNTNTIILGFAGSSLNLLENAQEDQLRLFLCESNIVGYFHGGPHKFQTQEESCYFDWMYERDKRLTSIHTVSPGTIGEFSPERSAQVMIVHVFADFRFEIERIPIGVNPIYPDYLPNE